MELPLADPDESGPVASRQVGISAPDPDRGPQQLNNSAWAEVYPPVAGPPYQLLRARQAAPYAKRRDAIPPYHYNYHCWTSQQCHS